MNTIKQVNYHNNQVCYNILSPYRIYSSNHFAINFNYDSKYKDYRRFLLGQTIGCYAQVWQYDKSNFATTFVFSEVKLWSDYKDAMIALDKILIDKGFILCNSEEEFMKYGLLI